MSLPIPLPPPIPLGRSVRYIPRMFCNNEQKKIEATRKDYCTKLFNFIRYLNKNNNVHHRAFWIDSNGSTHEVFGLNG